jgi:hypothetical protein
MSVKYPIFTTLAALFFSSPALAQEEPAGPISVSGSVALVSDYRFRGVSQTDKEMAIQGGLTVSHESGAYVGTWASNLSGWGTFGGANMELDLIAGFAVPIGGAKLDLGVTWYMYPGGADKTDFLEPYVRVSTDVGPGSVLVGVAYAPKQEALGRWSLTGASAQAAAAGLAPFDAPGSKKDNLYIWGDVNAAIPKTPVTLKAHLGYSDGNSGLGPNGTSVAPTGKYMDWLLGADVAVGPVTLGVAYVDTDISKSDGAYLQPNFSSTKDGSSIAAGRVVFSATLAM